MTLPWLRKKNQTPTSGVIKMSAGGKMEETDGDSGLNSCAEDLITAIKTNNAAAVAEALRSAFQIFDSMPDEDDQSGEIES